MEPQSLDRKECHESEKFYCFKLSFICEDDDRKRSFTSLCLKELQLRHAPDDSKLRLQDGNVVGHTTDTDSCPLGIKTEEITWNAGNDLFKIKTVTLADIFTGLLALHRPHAIPTRTLRRGSKTASHWQMVSERFSSWPEGARLGFEPWRGKLQNSALNRDALLENWK